MPCFFANNPSLQNMIRWGLLGATVLSWIFSIVATASCTFLMVGSDKVGFGLFSGERIGGGCIRYNDLGFDVDYDGPHITARLFGVVACLALSFAMVGFGLVVFVLSNHGLSQKVWLATRILFCVALFSCFLMFSYVASYELCQSDIYPCTLGAAGICNILNILLLTAMVFFCWCVDVPEGPLFKKGNGALSASGGATVPSGAAATATTHRTIEVTAKGRKITEEVTHPDGTKTTTTTFESTETSMDDDEEEILVKPIAQTEKVSQSKASSNGHQPTVQKENVKAKTTIPAQTSPPETDKVTADPTPNPPSPAVSPKVTTTATEPSTAKPAKSKKSKSEKKKLKSVKKPVVRGSDPGGKKAAATSVIRSEPM